MESKLIQCPLCGYQAWGSFCSHCGCPLPDVGSLTFEPPTPEAPWTNKCPVCKSGQLKQVPRGGLLKLLGSDQSLTCTTCNAVFTPTLGRFRLTEVSDRSSPIWLDYGNQALTEREWKRIAYGGVSDAKHRNADVGQWLARIRKGETSDKIIWGNSKVETKPNEIIRFILPGVTLWESSKISAGFGIYWDVNFIAAEAVSLDIATPTSSNHVSEKPVIMDQGTLTITNSRLVFNGAKHALDFNLTEILSLESYRDGIAVSASNSRKTHYLISIHPSRYSLPITVKDRQHKVVFSGLLLQYLIEGLLKQST